MNHPARYALVEIENVHDNGLEFEPIHRVLFQVKQDLPESPEKLLWRESAVYCPAHRKKK